MDLGKNDCPVEILTEERRTLSYGHWANLVRGERAAKKQGGSIGVANPNA